VILRGVDERVIGLLCTLKCSIKKEGQSRCQFRPVIGVRGHCWIPIPYRIRAAVPVTSYEGELHGVKERGVERLKEASTSGTSGRSINIGHGKGTAANIYIRTNYTLCMRERR
jgi:hypothetical protein